MRLFSHVLSILFLSTCLMFFIGCSGNSSSKAEQELQAPVKSSQPGFDDSAVDSLNRLGSVTQQRLLEKYKHLHDYFVLMEQQDADLKLKHALQKLKERPYIVNEVSQLYKYLSRQAEKDQQDFYGESRWRAVYLLAELRNKRANKLLFEIASSDMPPPSEVSEPSFKAEFRIRARAITGLEKLKDVESLETLYRKKNLLSGVAAASLFELGSAPKGVTKLNEVQVMGLGDATDFNKVTSKIDKDRLYIPAVSGLKETSRQLVPVTGSNK
ncbi:MAG: hypothetical protein OEY11_10455 [Gammaproteobacteria bacterium]|nr:hypothetical protein [Gammaproteobacteria bacterium]